MLHTMQSMGGPQIASDWMWWPRGYERVTHICKANGVRDVVHHRPLLVRAALLFALKTSSEGWSACRGASLGTPGCRYLCFGSCTLGGVFEVRMVLATICRPGTPPCHMALRQAQLRAAHVINSRRMRLLNASSHPAPDALCCCCPTLEGSSRGSSTPRSKKSAGIGWKTGLHPCHHDQHRVLNLQAGHGCRR